MNPDPRSKDEQYELQLTHRQVVTVLLLLLTVMAMSASMAYIAGRSVTTMQMARTAARDRDPDKDNHPKKATVLVVEPHITVTPKPTSAPTPMPTPVPTSKPAA